MILVENEVQILHFLTRYCPIPQATWGYGTRQPNIGWPAIKSCKIPFATKPAKISLESNLVLVALTTGKLMSIMVTCSLSLFLEFRYSAGWKENVDVSVTDHDISISPRMISKAPSSDIFLNLRTHTSAIVHSPNRLPSIFLCKLLGT